MITFIAVLIMVGSIGVAGWPLLRGIGGSKSRLVEDVELSEMLAQKDTALLAISEVESDYEMGSLSRNDYEELRKKYEEKAVGLIKTTEELLSERGLNAVSQLDQEIEDQVSEARSRKERPASLEGPACLHCGATIRPDDVFCFHCGTALSSKCPDCSATVNQDDRFCARCGAVLGNGGKK